MQLRECTCTYCTYNCKYKYQCTWTQPCLSVVCTAHWMQQTTLKVFKFKEQAACYTLQESFEQ